MASVDDIFKHAGVSSKRKLDPIRDPNEVYKSAKTGANGTNRHAQVDDGPDGEEAGPAPPPEEDDDRDFGPAMAPGDDDEADGDEEGRFFGGGISKKESEILDYVQDADDTTVAENIDAAWLRKTALNFEKNISKNAELRAKFESEPQKFIVSEADLDGDIKGLSILSEHPELYGEFVRLGCAASLVSLLAHENTDIALAAVEIIGELTDEDVAAEESQWNALVDALVDADLLGLLGSNLSRLSEDDDDLEREGVYFVLGVLENLCSRAPTAARVGRDDTLSQWLLKRIQRKEVSVSQNKQYSAEIIAILAQTSAENRRRFADLDAVDLMLQLVAPYRRRDPDQGGEEEEYMQNLFEALTCFVDEAEGKNKFINAEGTELCLIMIKEGKMSKAPALRLLDHATGGPAGATSCIKVVEAGGLKTLFTIFMKTQDHRLLGHVLAIMASLLRLLPSDSAERIRTLAKFVEKDYEKLVKLVKLRREYDARVRRTEADFKQERMAAVEDAAEDAEVELLSRRLDAGLFSLQLVDIVLAWLVAEDSGARRMIKKLLAERDETLDNVRRTISEQMGALDTSDEDNRDLKDMLGTLIEFLQ